MLTFDEPVSSFGVDILHQSLDYSEGPSIRIVSPTGETLSFISRIPSGSAPGGAHGGSVFVGVVSETANISKVIFDEADGNDIYPDANIGYDTFRYHPFPATASITITQPPNGAQLSAGSTVLISGIAEVDSRFCGLSQVTVDGLPVEVMDGPVPQQLDSFILICYDSENAIMELFILCKDARQWSGLLQRDLIDFGL
jgi:hypothetical protein